MFKYIKLGLLLSIVSLFFLSNSFSQKNTVKLEGWVKDRQGNPANNRTILVTNIKTNYSAKTVTDDKGYYFFQNIPVGRYKIVCVGGGIRSEDIITVNAKIQSGYDYLISFPNWKKGELSSFIHEGEIKFVVTDRKGKQIPNAEVCQEGASCYPIADSGIATYSFKPGNLTFIITVPNYKSQKKSVRLKPDESKVLNFRLRGR